MEEIEDRKKEDDDMIDDGLSDFIHRLKDALKGKVKDIPDSQPSQLVL